VLAAPTVTTTAEVEAEATAAVPTEVEVEAGAGADDAIHVVTAAGGIAVSKNYPKRQ
jgi:hypothetical protein